MSSTSEIHARLARQVELRREQRNRNRMMREWYHDLLCRKERENAQQRLFAEEARGGCKAVAYVVLLVLIAAGALVMWLVGC